MLSVSKPTQQKITDLLPQKLPGNTKPATRRKLRNACFTLNNPTVTREAFFSDLVTSGKVSYVVIGSEVGESGTPHFQGYVELKGQMDFHIVHEMLRKAHIEIRWGTAQQAADYCRKDGAFIEWGTISAQGERTDIHMVAEMIRDKYSMLEIASTYPIQYIKYFKGIWALQAALIEPRNEVPTVKVYCGPTGTGKSYKARSWLPEAYIWHPQQGQWFDGYRGEKQVIFEEFRGQIPFGMVLSLLDRYCCKVQYKGGVTEFAATEIAFTSPVSPSEWYLSLGENDRLDQLLRRITEVHRLRA